MPSLLSHLAALYLKRFRRPSFVSEGAVRAAIVKARAQDDHRPLPKTVGGLQVERRMLQGAPIYELGMKGSAGAPILYLHGGAFCFEITPFHWSLIAQLAVALNRKIVVPIYPLAPEAGAVEVLSLLTALWGEMTAEGQRPAIVGDSAGGNLALVLSMLIADKAPQPAALSLLSPCVDMTLRHPEIMSYAARDPWLAIEGALAAVKLYARDIDLADWRISPIFGPVDHLPPTQIFIGDRELLYPDVKDFAASTLAAGREVSLVEGKGLFHIWPLLPIPEARPARAEMIAFLRSHLQP